VLTWRRASLTSRSVLGGIRDWNVANIQQTDTIQQFLAAELFLAPGQRSLIPAKVTTGTTTVNGQTVPWRIDATTCKNTVATVPPHNIKP
jgi:hypothetical protein